MIVHEIKHTYEYYNQYLSRPLPLNSTHWIYKLKQKQKLTLGNSKKTKNKPKAEQTNNIWSLSASCHLLSCLLHHNRPVTDLLPSLLHITGTYHLSGYCRVSWTDKKKASKHTEDLCFRYCWQSLFPQPWMHQIIQNAVYYRTVLSFLPRLEPNDSQLSTANDAHLLSLPLTKQTIWSALPSQNSQWNIIRGLKPFNKM